MKWNAVFIGVSSNPHLQATNDATWSFTHKRWRWNRMKSNAQSTFQMPCCNLRATHFCGERIFFTVWLTSFGVLLHLDPQLRLPDGSCSPSHYFMFSHLFSSGRLWVQCECFESWSPSSPTRAHCLVRWTRQHQFPVFIDKEVGVCLYLEVELDYASLPHSCLQ